MAIERCPGQDMRFWRPDDIYDVPCPECGEKVEFWKNDPRRTCPNCGKAILNPKVRLGCAKWCPYAAECLGSEASAHEDASVRDRLIRAMQRVFRGDAARARHTLKVLDFAERLLDEEGGDPLVVKAAAILHDIGICAAELKHGSGAGRYQQIEGPPIARKILDELGIAPGRVQRVCDIIAHHHEGDRLDSTEGRIIWDADHLAALPEALTRKAPEKQRAYVEGVFRTRAGRTLALMRLRARSAAPPHADEHAG